MGLLKAADVEYILPEQEDTELDLEYLEESTIEAESDGYLKGSRDFELSTPVIIGGDGLDFDFSTLEYDTLDEDTVFFAAESTEVIFAETVTIGGSRQLAPEVDTFDEYESYEEESMDEYTMDEELDEYAMDEEFTEEEVEEGPRQLPDFSSMGDATEDESAAAAAFMNNKRNTMMTRLDDKVRNMMKEQTDSLKEKSAEQISFVSSEEKNRLVSEALETIKDAPMSGELDFEKIFQDIADYIENLAWHHTEKLHQDLDEERQLMVQSVEEYVENSILEQREQMMQEAESYISETVQQYKQSLNEDNEYIKAANQIIAERETILDEAYTKSLQMVQEAEEQQQQILEEAFMQQEQAQQMIQEAESQIEMMAQEAQQEAERIISEANMESARIIEAAEQSHQEIVEAATQDGFNVGYQEGREEAIKENAQLLMETTNALNKLHAAFPVAVKQNEDKLIKLALEISREVIQEELQMKPELCLKAVERAIGKVSDLEKVLIKVNPLDLDIVLPKQEYFKSLLPDVQDFVITGHYSIERGGCHIETNSGTIDAQITTQLAVVEEVFQQIRSEYDFDEDDDDMDEEDEI